MCVDLPPERARPGFCCKLKRCLCGTRGAPQQYGSGGLGNADLVCRDLATLSVINMRNLFAQEGSQFMDLQKELSDAEPSLPLTSVGTQEVDSRPF